MNNEEIERRTSVVQQIITQAADEVRTHLGRNQRITAQAKGIPTDLVTEVDVMVNRMFQEGLRSAFPQDHILSEESKPPEGVDLAQSPGVHIIDPIDGTNNLVLGNENFWISAAFACNGHPEVAAVVQPVTRRMYIATRERVVHATGGREALNVSPVSDMQQASIGFGFGYSKEEKRATLRLMDKVVEGDFRLPRVIGTWVGAITDVACGRLHAVIGSGHPWDVAAVGLLVERAGGKITHQDGSSWTPFRPDFIASNGHLHDRLVELVNA